MNDPTLGFPTVNESEDHTHNRKDVADYYKRLRVSHQLKERMRAASELGYLGWLGGVEIQTYIGKIGVLQTFLEILENQQEPQALKMKIIQAISILCRNNKHNQDLLRGFAAVQILADYLQDTNEDMRMWSAHALFFLLSGNPANQHAALKIPTLKSRLIKVADDSWNTRQWNYNDAMELLKLLRLIPLDDSTVRISKILHPPGDGTPLSESTISPSPSLEGLNAFALFSELNALTPLANAAVSAAANDDKGKQRVRSDGEEERVESSDSSDDEVAGPSSPQIAASPSGRRPITPIPPIRLPP